MPGSSAESSGDDAIRALRDALSHSPTNVPLRLHLGETLLAHGRAAEAEREFRETLAMAPDHKGVQLGLARAFYQQGKNSHALALIETVVKTSNPSGRALLLHARLLAGIGEIEQAVIQYKRALEQDPGVADADLARRLGIRARAEAEAEPPPSAGSVTFGGPGAPGTDPGAPGAGEGDDAEVVDGRVRASWSPSDGGGPGDAEIERPRIGFADVGGMEALKEEIRLKIIHPLAHPELYKAYGKAIGGGILMYGPPGCGKTHLARATAGEIRAGFIAVGINDVLDMWIGNSERNLHALFEQARRNRPCVLFFDEVDALGASRSDMRHHAGRQLINQFLAEMDGVKASNEGVLILAATNAPWHLDAAFRRPGRFDRVLFVPPPDAPARAGILRLLCSGKPLEDPDYDQVARKTEHFSGADLKAVVDLAVEQKLREAMKTGKPRPLQTKDLVAAAAGQKATTREWFATARNYALYSNQGGIYDDILHFLKLK